MSRPSLKHLLKISILTSAAALLALSASTYLQARNGDRLARTGLALHPLATWNDILQADVSKQFDPAERRQIEDFLADPIAWSIRHGGRSALQSRKH